MIGLMNVPAAATASPARPAAATSASRVRNISSRNSAALAQILVPTSTIDWCSSRFMRSPSTAPELARSSDTCERSSHVEGSTIWNSSSTPSVKRCMARG
jgi:hypothetical protein